MDRYFLGLITRCRDEPFLAEFVNHYFHEGVDEIFIVDDNVEMEMPPSVINDNRIVIEKSQKWTSYEVFQMADVNRILKKIRNKFDWIISVDCDEFITTRRNPDNSIRDELKTTFSEFDYIKIPWVMMACNGREKNPKKLLEELTYRWDYDKIHTNPYKWNQGDYWEKRILGKSITRANVIKRMLVHKPTVNNLYTLRSASGATGKIDSYDIWHENYGNEALENSVLVCYHYRIYSRESVRRKIKYFKKFREYRSNKPTEKILMRTDYPEIIDETMKNKSLIRKKKL